MNIKSVLISSVFLLTLLGLYSCTSEKKGPAPELAEAREAEYSGIYDYPVRLTGGSFKGEPFAKDTAARPTVGLIGDLCVQGDLDGDGIDESVVLLVENSGGSGSFIYIALLERVDGGVKNTGTAPLGDRVQVRSLWIEPGTVMMKVIQHGPEDPLCCPTQNALRNWVLEGGTLLEGEAAITGIVSLSDIEGIRWILESFASDDPYHGNPPVTLMFGDGKVSGSAGCNRYFTDITEVDPGVIKLGMTGSTRMACGDEAMLIEERYLTAVSGASGYSFLAGKLALTCRVEDRIVTMIFKPGVTE